ncbi:MAG: SpoIIIAH-like family protein [Lachnospiraceae bacterium]|nr:SpoIIIAH-like family protein [Lachnospiraceae bacterium]
MKKILKKNQLMITALALMIAVAGYLHFSGDVSDQITISEGAAEEQTENTASEAATMIEYTVEDTYTAEELAQMGLNDDMSATDDGMAMFDISDEDMLTDIESLDSELADTDDGYEDELSSIESILAESSDVQEGEVPGEAVFTSTISINTLQGAKLMKEQTRAENKAALMEIINSTNIADDQKQIALNSIIGLTETAEKEMSAEILLDARGFEDAVVSITGDTVDVVVYSADLSDSQRAQIEDIVMRKTGTPIENIVISTTLN